MSVEWKHHSLGAKAVTWDKAILDRYGTEKLCLKLTEQQIVALLAVATEQMSWATRWFNASASDVSRFATETAYALMSATRCETAATTNNFGSSANSGNENSEECEDMGCNLTIEYRSGKPFLRLDCGCGVAKYFSLVESDFDSSGNPVAAGDMYTGDFPLTVSGDNASCYGEKAANYLIDRAIAFWHTVVDLIVVGLDGVSNVDEIIDVTSIVLQLSSGSTLQELVGDSTKAQISSAFNAIKTAMANNWTATGSVNRAALLKWTQTAPYFQDSIPVREMLFTWASTSFVLGYNEQLAIYAAECETGSEFIPQTPAIPLGGTFYAVEIPGNWNVTLSGDFANLTNPLGGKIIGVGMVAERTGGTDFSTIAAFNENDTDCWNGGADFLNFDPGDPAASPTLYYSATTTYRTAIQAVYTDFLLNTFAAGFPATSIRMNSTNGGMSVEKVVLFVDTSL